MSLQIFSTTIDESIDQWRTNQPVTTVHSFTPIELTSLSRDDYPSRLIDLQTNTVVLTSSFTTLAEYTVLSHVWGTALTFVDGQKYGVDWGVPIRSEEKLNNMLDGVRAYGRTRYCWLDVLCVPQGDEGKNYEGMEYGFDRLQMRTLLVSLTPYLSKQCTKWAPTTPTHLCASFTLMMRK